METRQRDNMTYLVKCKTFVDSDGTKSAKTSFCSVFFTGFAAA